MPVRLRWLVATLFTSVGFTPCADGQGTPSGRTVRVAPWTLISAVGYGAAGLGVGATALSYSANGFGGDVLTVTAFTASGVVGGIVIGRRASWNLRDAQPIGRWHQLGLSSGAVFAGAALGALAAAPLINSGGEGTALGSDEATVAKTAAIGSAVGLLFALTQQRSLKANRLAVVPYRAAYGASGVRIHVRF